MKKICLCITNYHKEEFLERSIRSCISQIPYDVSIEVIVVNDGSKKFNKKKIQNEFPQVKILDLVKNKGVAFASNKAINFSNADYFMRVDADDYLSIKSSMILSQILDENPDISFAYGDILKIKLDSRHSKIKRNNRKTLFEHGAGIMFRLNQLKKIKGYDTSLKNCEDFDLLIRLEKTFGRGFYLPILLYRYYKTHGAHLTSSKNRKFYKFKLERKYEKYLSKNS